MKYWNNLTDVSENTYFFVKKPFEVLIKIGHSDSNTWFGRAKALGNVWKRVTLGKDDQLHDTYGGVYAIIGGEPYKATMYVSEKHPFEKTYGRSIEEWPVENLEEIDHPNLVQKPKGSYHRDLPMMEPGQFIGRSIDSVVNP